MNIPNYHRRRIMRAEIAVDSVFPDALSVSQMILPRSPESPAWSALRPDAHIVRYIPPYRARSAGYRPVYPPVSILLHESSFYHLLTGKNFFFFHIPFPRFVFPSFSGNSRMPPFTDRAAARKILLLFHSKFSSAALTFLY